MPPKTDSVHITTQNPFLQTCSERTRDAVAELGAVRAFDSGEALFKEGEPGGVVLFPLSGSLQVSKTAPRGRRQVLCTLGPRSCCGMCMLPMVQRSVADIHALEAGQAVVLPLADFQVLARHDSLLCQTAWRAAAQCISHLGDLIEHLSFHKVGQRVASRLLEGAEHDGDLVRLTQAQLAAEVGTTREVVARCLGDLQRAGAVRLGRGRITVLHRDLLASETAD